MTTDEGTRASVKFPSGVANTMTYEGNDRLATLVTKNAAGTTTFVNETYSYALATTNTQILQKMTDAVTADKRYFVADLARALSDVPRVQKYLISSEAVPLILVLD